MLKSSSLAANEKGFVQVGGEERPADNESKIELQKIKLIQMLNSKSQAGNNSQIEPQKHIEPTSSPTCIKTVLATSCY